MVVANPPLRSAAPPPPLGRSSAASASASASAGGGLARAHDARAFALALGKRARLVGTGPLGVALPHFEMDAREAALAEQALGLPRDALGDAIRACTAALREAAPRVRGLARAGVGMLIALGGVAVILFMPKAEYETARSEVIPRGTTIGMSVIVVAALVAVLLYVQLRTGDAAALQDVKRLLASDDFQMVFTTHGGLRLGMHARPSNGLACYLALSQPKAAQLQQQVLQLRAAVPKATALSSATAQVTAATAAEAAAPPREQKVEEAEEVERKAPQRPLSAYQAFLADFKKTDAFAALPGGAAAKLQAVAEIWKALAEDERRVHTDRAAAALELYKAEAEAFARWSEARAEVEEARKRARAPSKAGAR